MFVAITALSGCGMFPYGTSTNIKLTESPPKPSAQASFTLREDEKYKKCSPKQSKDLVFLALSGGGSRAAYFSAMSMLEMQKIALNGNSNILSEVDLISSVSGGSLAAGYYAISDEGGTNDRCGPTVSGRHWNENTVKDLMAKNYIGRWFGNWFWPDNVLLYWFTNYDRTDIMAQTFADNLYDTSFAGIDLKFRDLNPARPNLVLNATKGSGAGSNTFGQPFTFTSEDFGKVCSSIDEYSVARGVMATATFPGVFNFMTLTNQCSDKKEMGNYVHLFDGGNSDNLGLTSIKRAIWNLIDIKNSDKQPAFLSQYKDKKIIVILIDSFTDSNGVSSDLPDPRHWYDYIADTNFITATDSLLSKNRDNLLEQFKTQRVFPFGNDELTRKIRTTAGEKSVEQKHLLKLAIIEECRHFFSWATDNEISSYCSKNETWWDELNDAVKDRMEFIHISFKDVPDKNLQDQLNNIKTDFRFNTKTFGPTQLKDEQAISCAVPTLFGKESGAADGCKSTYSANPELSNQWSKVIGILNASIVSVGEARR